MASICFTSVAASGEEVIERKFLLDKGRLQLDVLKSAFGVPYLVLDLGMYVDYRYGEIKDIQTVMNVGKTLICPAIAISHKEVLYYYGQINILL